MSLFFGKKETEKSFRDKMIMTVASTNDQKGPVEITHYRQNITFTLSELEVRMLAAILNGLIQEWLCQE